MSKINSLTNGGYIIYNKAIAQQFGINEAILIGELVQEHNYWNAHKGLQDGWFFSTIENIQNATGLSRHLQDKAIKTLAGAGIIQIRHWGMPSKRYFKIDPCILTQFVPN